MVEAAGVEPASQAREPAATTCLVRVNCRLQVNTPTRCLLLSQHGISRLLTRCPRQKPPRLNAFHPASRDHRANVTALGCEGQLVVSFYLFGSMIYEANEPSSACRLRRTYKVETSTPPLTLQQRSRAVSDTPNLARHKSGVNSAHQLSAIASPHTQPSSLRKAPKPPTNSLE